MSVLSFATRHAASRLLPSRLYQQRAHVPLDGGAGCHQTARVPVCLTFDDGPHPTFTPRVLDQLAAMGARATFFLIGGSAQQHPQLVRRILAEGHSIGSHTHCHSRATRMSADAYVRDAVRGRAMLEDLSGIACPLFRPPHGELTPLSLVKLLRTGMRIMHWTHEPKDFESNSNQQLMNWFQTHRPCRGAVVVLHDACRVTAHHLTEYLTAWRPVVRFCGLTPEGECQ